MRPINFNKHCQILKGNGKDIADLPVLPIRYRDMGKAMVTCYKLTTGDLFRLLWTRKVYMVILGDRCPATMLTADPLQVGFEQIRDEDYQVSRLDGQ